MNKLKLAAAMLLGIILPVHAQGVDPWLADHFNKEQRKAREYNQRMKQEMQQTRESRIREKAVQAQIKKYRKTPYYMVIVKDFIARRQGMSGGLRDKQKVIQKALQVCPNCQVLATFSNTCAAAAEPDWRANQKRMFLSHLTLMKARPKKKQCRLVRLNTVKKIVAFGGLMGKNV